MDFRRRLFYVILVSSLIRLFIAGFIELGNDEVYYYTYALHLQWNYFDHPPGVALLIRLTTLNLLFTNELFVPLGSVLCCAAGTLVSYFIGLSIRNKQTGCYAALLYNTILYTGVIAGTLDDLHNFAWLNHVKPALKANENALCIIPSNYFSNPENVYKPFFSSIQNLHTFTVERGGKPSLIFTVYLLKIYKGGNEMHAISVH